MLIMLVVEDSEADQIGHTMFPVLPEARAKEVLTSKWNKVSVPGRPVNQY